MEKEAALESSRYVFSTKLKTPTLKIKKLPVVRSARGHAEKTLGHSIFTRGLGARGRAGLEIKIKF